MNLKIGLSGCQFTKLMFLLHKMLNQVDADRRNKMLQEAPDEAMLEQRRYCPDVPVSLVYAFALL